MSKVWDESKQTGSHLLILLALADFSDDYGVCFPSVRRLAEKARMTERWVQVAIKKLVADGEIVVEEGKGPHGCNRFKFIKKGGEDKSGGGVKMTVDRGEDDSRGGEDDGNAYIGNRHKEPSKKEASESLSLFKEEDQKKEKEKLRTKEKEIPIPPELDTPEFRERWDAFKEDRKERRKTMTRQAQVIALNKMREWGEDDAIEAINKAIERGWAGVFQPTKEPVRTLGTGSGSSVERSLEDYYGPVTKRDPNKKLTTPEERKAIFDMVRRGVEARP